MRYPIAEKFKSLQGEGLYTGTPMAFIRLVGCSVGHKVCTSCDTDFDRTYPNLGGGTFSVEELVEWVGRYPIANLTGGEPLDREIKPLVRALQKAGIRVHIETSGTKMFDPLRHGSPDWVCVSPKPGYLPFMIDCADEIKVIHGGLGDGPGWATIENALEWADQGKLVYLQPCNEKHVTDDVNTQRVIDVVKSHPGLRASFQIHKVIHER